MQLAEISRQGVPVAGARRALPRRQRRFSAGEQLADDVVLCLHLLRHDGIEGRALLQPRPEQLVLVLVMMVQGIDHLRGVPEDPAGRRSVPIHNPAYHQRQEPEFASEHAVDEHHVACVGDGH